MAHLLSCPSGHVWEITSISDTVSLEIVPKCFHCGDPLTPVLTAPPTAVSSTLDPNATRPPSIVLSSTQPSSAAASSPEAPGMDSVVASLTARVSKLRPGELAVGTRVAGYDILGVLGSGGMAIVYKARQLQLNRIVALKMILRGSHGDEKRFRVEARAVARMQHPHIVQVYEIGDLDGEPFFSLEFCNGGSLNQKLKGMPLPPREAAALTEKLADATHSAHERGILHRDLKPANVLLVGGEGTPVSQCVPKIADFGLAKKLDEDGSARTGTVMGTPSYMPPEQMRGETELKATVDVYSLGALLYELLVGRPPFRAATPQETMQQVLLEEPVPPRRLQSKTPRDLETICLKCLQKSPSKRYATAKVLADDLHRFLAGEPIQARPVGRIEKAIKWVKRRPTVTALAGFLALAVLAGFAGIGWKWRDAVVAQNRSRTGGRTGEDLSGDVIRPV